MKCDGMVPKWQGNGLQLRDSPVRFRPMPLRLGVFAMQTTSFTVAV